MRRRAFLASVTAPLFGHSLEALNSWMALDLAGAVQCAYWPYPEQSVSMGSLLKPFLALSYLATHAEGPILDCHGTTAGCWYPPGHGRQNLVTALANSCNVYFRCLARDLDRAALELTCLSYGLEAPPRSWESSRLIGLGEGWPQTGLAAARAFALLARNSTDAHARIILSGMARCSLCGTAKEIGCRCYAKTGTAPCAHGRGGLGDGYVVAIYPLAEPRRIILAMRHNTTGAMAAKDVKPLLAEVG